METEEADEEEAPPYNLHIVSSVFCLPVLTMLPLCLPDFLRHPKRHHLHQAAAVLCLYRPPSQALSSLVPSQSITHQCCLFVSFTTHYTLAKSKHAKAYHCIWLAQTQPLYLKADICFFTTQEALLIRARLLISTRQDGFLFPFSSPFLPSPCVLDVCVRPPSAPHTSELNAGLVLSLIRDIWPPLFI
jgi:hypothetical protein